MQYNANDTERADRARELVEVVTIALGTSVEVRRRFDQAWARGFEVANPAALPDRPINSALAASLDDG